jgi:hypothetical protein
MRGATIKRCSWVSVDAPLILEYHDRAAFGCHEVAKFFSCEQFQSHRSAMGRVKKEQSALFDYQLGRATDVLVLRCRPCRIQHLGIAAKSFPFQNEDNGGALLWFVESSVAMACRSHPK